MNTKDTVLCRIFSKVSSADSGKDENSLSVSLILGYSH